MKHLLLAGLAAWQVAAAELPAPLHLDDMHLMVSDEAAAVDFLERRLGACEMAHADQPIDYVRYLSVRYGDPTFTITGPTPADEPDRLRAQTTGHVGIRPVTRGAPPHWGVYWVALATPAITPALAAIEADGYDAGAAPVTLPQAPDVPAVSFYGPDNLRFVLVARGEAGSSPLGVDHLLLLVSDVAASARFFAQVFAAREMTSDKGLRVLRVADATLVLAAPEVLGLDRTDVQPMPSIPWAMPAAAPPPRVVVPASVEHLGFLYAPGSLPALVAGAEARGYRAEYAPFRYVYRGRPSVFNVTEFLSPDGFGVEAVTADGRVGPHAYYRAPCPAHR